MEVIVGKTAGFCGGVKNAVVKTEEVLENGNTIYCLGELVHNEEIINKLKEKGLKIIRNIEDAEPFSTVIIRAHGEPKITYDKASKKHINLLDLTCPKVLDIHKKAEKYKNEEYAVFCIAEGEHPETIGTMGHLEESGILIQTEDDVDIAMNKTSNKTKYAILAQTTFSMEKFDKIVEKIKEKLPKDKILEINKTICNATQIRQDETKKMATKVDVMIIIGGKSSSNTRKLYEIAKSNCKEAHLIQTVNDMPNMSKYEKVGIMAGASTPQYLIDEVIKKVGN